MLTLCPWGEETEGKRACRHPEGKVKDKGGSSRNCAIKDLYKKETGTREGKTKKNYYDFIVRVIRLPNSCFRWRKREN